MASNVDPLVVGRVIGEVVDLFVPTTKLDVNFGTKHINNGCDIKPSMAADPPSVHIGGRPCHLFTLVCIHLKVAHNLSSFYMYICTHYTIIKRLKSCSFFFCMLLKTCLIITTINYIITNINK